MIKRWQVVRAALIAGFISFGIAAHAQETAPGGALPEVEITEEKIDAFAEATLALSEINRAYEEQAADVGTEEQREQLMMAVNVAMLDAVERVEGISVDEYNAMAVAAQSDVELNGAITEAIEARITMPQ
ncbi:DUF4168 domain-containing protein [Salinarimonas sp. NSM]|uniref:DUF4168 domain-containing protein n=1 Tax=Salinarimonas sp. NSM TaxID=3458003 RepID=UPI00403522B3